MRPALSQRQMASSFRRFQACPGPPVRGPIALLRPMHVSHGTGAGEGGAGGALLADYWGQSLLTAVRGPEDSEDHGRRRLSSPPRGDHARVPTEELSMQLRWAARGARAAAMARERIAKTGMAPGGRPVWTDRETALLAVIFPDYERAVAVLGRRTYAAVKQRARSMGLTKRHHIWTGAAVARLRRLYPSADHATLATSFPGVPIEKIRSKAQEIGVYRNRRQLIKTGIPEIDQIRGRAFELNISMVDLDAMAKTKKYFQKAGWLSERVSTIER